MRLARLPLALPALSLLAVPAAAQVGTPAIDSNDAAAAFALTTTPVGALAPTLPPALLGAGAPRTALRGHFGHMDSGDELSVRTFAGGIDIPLGRASLGLTAGYLDYACGDLADEAEDAGVDLDCSGGFVGGANVTAPLVTTPVGTGGSSFAIGVDGTIGLGSGDVLEASAEGQRVAIGGTSLSATIGLPVALVARTGSLTVAPHLTPRFGWGRGKLEVELPGESVSESESGTALMLGGGVALRFAGGFGLDVGFSKVFVDDTETVIGVGVSWALR